MRFIDIPKFVINLKKRPERLSEITQEMNYMSWDFEVFKGIDANGYMGCTLSHLEIIKIAKERGYSKVMVIEDDCVFMPYSKKLLKEIEFKINDLDYYVLNLSPTLNRHVNISEDCDLLLDLTKLPDKKHDYLTETFATNILIYDEKIYNEMFKISEEKFQDGNYFYPIDGFLAKVIYPKFQSYCPKLPIAPQRSSYSDVSHDVYNNFYTQTYNWNGYSPIKIPSEYMDYNNNQKLKYES
jgi:GR25 family glycosyltransferase involved in LPS biosynthesis